MEKFKKDNEEQPQKINEAHAATAEDRINGADINIEGSSLGKFKDAKSLMQAYENLQKEFTRKSQKLSDALKELTSIKENVDENSTPDYARENWQEKVGKFLQNNPSAKQFTAEISDVILNDKVLSNSPNSLELAWAKVLARKYKSEETLSQDEDFINTYIINKKEVQDKIIKNYLSSLQQNTTVPVISMHTGSAFSLAPKNKPQNLAEAKKIAEQFFKI